MSTLADLCLLNIFASAQKKFPLSGQKCLKWAQFHRRYASTRRSLTLLIGQDAEALIEFYEPRHFLDGDGCAQKMPSLVDATKNTLELSVMSQQQTQHILDIFPYITDLVIVFDNSEGTTKFECAMSMLAHWGPRLESLYWYGTLREDELDYMKSYQLQSTINAMLNLKRLRFRFEATYNVDSTREIQLPVCLSILGQLEEFDYELVDLHFDQFFNSLRQYGEANQNLKFIRLYTMIESRSYHKFLTLSSDFAARFQTMVLCYDFDNGRLLLQNMCGHFSNLTHLKLKLFVHISRVELANSFSMLPQLSQFDLTTNSMYLVHLSLDVGEVILPLTSLQLFRITIHDYYETIHKIYSHSLVPNFEMHKIFPNVQLLVLICSMELYSVCEQCHRVGQLDRSICHKMMMRPLFDNSAKLKCIENMGTVYRAEHLDDGSFPRFDLIDQIGS